MKFNPDDVARALKHLRDGNYVTKYLRIQRLACQQISIAENKEFQKAFNGFYKVRQRPESWYSAFYESFEEWKYKRQMISFSAVLADLKHRTKQFEPSFSSKLVAVLDPQAPVWDTELLARWNLKAPWHGHSDRFAAIVQVYEALRTSMTALVEARDGRSIAGEFDQAFPTEAPELTAMKKVDLTLWQLRER